MKKWLIATVSVVAAINMVLADETTDTQKQTTLGNLFDRIDLAIGATGVIQGTPGIDDEFNTETDDRTDAAMSFDVELSVGVTENGQAFLLMESGSGDGLDGNFSSFSGFNGDADDDPNLRVTEFWYEHNWLENKIRIRAGKVDLTSNFDCNAIANSETDQFLSGGFVNNLAVDFPSDNGVGGMIWAIPSELIQVGIGVADGDADGDNVFEDMFTIAEIDIMPVIAGQQGNYRVYGWFNDSEHIRITGEGDTESNSGFGVSLDQGIINSLSIFGRYGMQDEDVAIISQYWSAGLQLSGSLWGRTDDTFGIAYGSIIMGDNWEDFYESSLLNPGDEGHLEIFYGIAVNGNLNISPDIQWIKNASCREDNDDLWAFGVRAQLTL